MTAHRPEPAVLENEFVRLAPMTMDDVPALYEAIGRHRETFASGWGNGPGAWRPDLAGFTDFAESYFDWGRSNVHTVRMPDGELVGTTTLGDFEERFEHAHIGWTAYSSRVWGTAVNPACKLLLLEQAFDAGFGRVKIQADVVNERSRAAIAKLGATFEGIVRRDRPRADGSWRDSAIYSILIDEWPDVRAGLEQRLARHASA